MTNILTLSLHVALPISGREQLGVVTVGARGELAVAADPQLPTALVERPRQLVCHFGRSRRIQAAVTPHHLHLRALALDRKSTRLQSHSELVCRLLLEKK